jgi:DMSO/TMAO reductase YedYZ heme-binding membrane subunit
VILFVSSFSGRRRHARAQHWAVLAAVTAAAIAVGLSTGSDAPLRLSRTFAYLGLGGLLATLAVSPLRRLAKRPVATNIYLRRDIGIWAALASASHVAVALGRVDALPVLRYFTRPGSRPLLHPRTDQLGWASFFGLIALVGAIALVGISNDRAVRRLGRRWKRYQRANYLIVGAAAIHSMLFWSVLHSRGVMVSGASLAMTGLIVLRIVSAARAPEGATSPRPQ